MSFVCIQSKLDWEICYILLDVTSLLFVGDPLFETDGASLNTVQAYSFFSSEKGRK